MKKSEKISFWENAETKEAIKNQAAKEDREMSSFLRFKIKKIRSLEKW